MRVTPVGIKMASEGSKGQNYTYRIGLFGWTNMDLKVEWDPNDDTHLSLQSSQSGVEKDCLLYLWRRRGADLSVLSRLCTSVPPPHFFVVKHTDNFSLDKADHTLSLIFQHF